MAKRRLNKKVALIGSAVFAVVALGAIWVLLGKSRDPEKFLNNGDAAMLAEDYEAAASSYRAAYSRAGTNTLKEKILFKLVDAYIGAERWNYVPWCWDEVVRVNPNNAKARFGRLEYFYILADSGNREIWQRVRTEAAEFLEVAEDADLLMENTAEWDIFATEQEESHEQRLRDYLYLVRGRAALEVTRMGAVVNKDKALAEAVADLEQLREFEPNNIDVYLYLAEAAVEKGNILASKGHFQERDKAALEAVALLEQGVKAASDNPKAHINLLIRKLLFTRRDTRDTEAKDKIKALEPEFLALVKRFPSNPEAFVALSDFYSGYSSYSGPQTALEYLNKAIGAAEKAVEMEEDNVPYAINVMNLHYGKFSLYKQKRHLDRAIEIAKKALTFPGAQETPGPRSYANRVNQFILSSFLAHAYVSEVLEPCEVRTESQTQDWLANAERAVHGIEQILGSGQELHIVKWRGMLELAKGNRKSAVKKLYTAYEQTKAVKPPKPPWRKDSQFAYLSYLLAKVFENSTETGIVAEFLTSALYSGIISTVPEAYLDYVETIMKFNMWSDAIENIDAFEKRFTPNDRSRILRIKTYIGAGEFDKATNALKDRPEDDPNTIELSLALVQAKILQTRINIIRTESRDFVLGGLVREKDVDSTAADVQVMKKELNEYREFELQLVNKLLPIRPDSIGESSIIGICQYYVEQGEANKATELVGRFLKYFPENTRILLYEQILAEPEPGKVSEQRRTEIGEQVLSKLTDPAQRSLQLGMFYYRDGELQKAVAEFNKVLEVETPQEKSPRRWTFEREEETSPRRLAANRLFDIAIETKDWELAAQVIEMARRDDIDLCQGNVFLARLAVAKQDFKKAITLIDECLKQRPVFSRAYMLRGSVNAALENEHAALEDIRKAVSLNPLDSVIAKGFAHMLYRRNKKLGDNVTPDQIIESRNALERAMALTPGDLDLRSLYAEFVASAEPLKAVVILQALQRADPSLQNSVRLGELATSVAIAEKDNRRREALFVVAGAAFEDAMKIDPNLALPGYTNYLRAAGRDKEVVEVLNKFEEKMLLWNHYFQRGQYQDAKRVLEQLYESNPNDIGVVKGLLLVAEKMDDESTVEKYSQELISLDPRVDSYLIQIQSFLRVGLIREAGLKLQSFTEKYPDELRTLLLRAWLVMRKGQLPEALGLTNRYLATDPDNHAAWRLRGEIYFYGGNITKAISDLKKSKSLLDDPKTRISLAKAHLRIERYDDAITELRNAINAPLVPVEARLLLEQIYERVDRKDSLRRFYDETLREFPTSAYWLNRAGAFAVKAGEFDKAEQLYGKSYQIKRQEHLNQSMSGLSVDGLYAAAFDGYLNSLLLQAGIPNTNSWKPAKLDKLFELAKEYEETEYASVAFLRMAQAKDKLGYKKTAIEYCRKAVDKAQTNEKLASEVLLRMFFIVGPGEVEKYCTEKLQANPNSLAAHFTLFNLAKINRNYEKAVFHIDKCIQLAGPDSPRRVDYMVKKAEVLTLAYQRSSDNKFLKMAVADYESLLVKMPNNTSVLNNLAYMLVESAESNESLAKALGYAERAHNMKPNDPGIMDTYGYVLHKNGKNLQALEHLTAATQQYEQKGTSKPPELYEHLGMAKEALGDKETALGAYKQALEVGVDTLSYKDKERINKAIKRLSP